MSALIDVLNSYAKISDDGLYRYTLGRVWASRLPHAVFIMLNPSTADADRDDPTIRRCIGFAKREGCGAIHVVNLYAYRTTKPKHLWETPDPVGPENDSIIAASLSAATGPIIAAWGANAKPERIEQILSMPNADCMVALGLTKTGQPRHPLYVRADAPLVPFGAKS